MSLFGFDAGFSMFDVTPVENIFLQEYLPAAKGEYVKVYLYGLMQAYHPGEEMTVAAMAHDLSLTEEEVMAAFRYWERRGLCIRISDQPPAFRYRSLAQMLLTQQKPPRDTAYEAFAEALYAMFGDKRKLHGGESTLAYEWVEEMGLPPEVVLMIVQHQIQTKGINFSFAAAQKLAVKMAEEKVTDAEGAELFLARDKKVRENAKQVLRRMGKKRLPSEDELDLCQKWMTQWQFTLEDMLAACAETTKGDPNFKYLDGILNGLYQRSGGKTGAAQQLALEKEKAEPLKKLIQALGNRRLSVNESTLADYEKLCTLAQPEVILMAGRECARSENKDLEDVAKTLKVLKRSGITTPQQAQAYFEEVRQLNEQLLTLFALWGRTQKPANADRTLWVKWTRQWQFSQEAIEAAADFGREAARPMPYLDKLLKDCAEKGLKEPSAIREHLEKNRAKPRPGKTVTQQQYTQRPHNEDDLLTDLKKYMKEFEE